MSSRRAERARRRHRRVFNRRAVAGSASRRHRRPKHSRTPS